MTNVPPVLRPLHVANHALGDRSALTRIWEERGYLFFRDVLDKRAVAEARGKVLNVLAGMGVIAPGADDAHWNGSDLSAFPDKVDALYRAGIWQALVAHPGINDFFEEVIGESIGWIALSGYRTTAPASRETEDPFEGRHQDGFMNGSIPFRTCWIPLHEINAETGGLALAEGLHHSRYLHDALDPPRFRIPRGSIPDDAWRSSDYAPGDVIMFDIGIPHAGLPNRSRRFRLSLDARLIPASHPERPLEGAIVSLERNRVVVRDERGCIREAAIDETTYFRGHSGARLPFEALAPLLPSGMKAMVGVRHGVATILRPAR